MVRHTLKTLQQILQDFKSVSDHFTTLQSKGLIAEKRDDQGYQIYEDSND